jgi:hypothetical protein
MTVAIRTVSFINALAVSLALMLFPFLLRHVHPWHRLYCGQQTVEIIVRSDMRVDDDNKRKVFSRCSIGLVDRAGMSAVGQKANTPRDEMVPLYLQSRTSMLSAGPFRAIKRYRG